MLTPNALILISVGYVAFLFLVAYVVDRRASSGAGGMRWLSSPVVYTLSISVYCTAWTFYGAVGSAARNGLEFLTIYLGPTLVFVGWWWLLRKLVRIGRRHRITSIADLISSRYGKSPSLAVLVTLIAVVGTTPYIALQLQSVTLSFEVLAGPGFHGQTAFWIAAGMALFTILFGTRGVNANERHHGVVAAIALEALVKLAAMIAVGAFVLFGALGGIGEAFDRMPQDMIDPEQVFGPRWAMLTFLAATAVICLPRQFQVTVVENVDERHLATASWLFPLYLFLMCLFVVPIAIAGQTVLAPGENPDMYLLTVPLALGRQDLALLAYIGGFSSATSMVIVAVIALATMVSNHVVMPMALRFFRGGLPQTGDMRDLLLMSRRASIVGILGLGFLYFRLTGGTDALAAIGLIAFAGLAQVLPSLLGGVFWRGATRAGALAGLGTGFAIWAYTLFLPSFEGAFLLSEAVLAEGPLGIAALRPQALFGVEIDDPLMHALLWSLGFNMLSFVLVSLGTLPNRLERLQGALFVDVYRSPEGETPRYVERSATAEDLFVLAQRILGTAPAERLFADIARAQGVAAGLPRPTDACIARLEQELAGSVGAASAHAMVASVAGRGDFGLSALFDIADETQRLMETSARLAEKTGELERTATQLREVNARLRALDQQKDDFLSQVSHELRTPMTSIRSFAELLMSEDLDPDQTRRFAGIIHEESLRLTRLLDEILDVNRLESGAADLPLETVSAEAAVASALESLEPVARAAGITLLPREAMTGQYVRANPDRLRQVLLNLIGNAIKYNTAPEPTIRVAWQVDGKALSIDVIDNGGGVSEAEAEQIFAKFVRGHRSAATQGAGLGLPISRAIVARMGGALTVVFNEDGTSFFRVRLPRASARRARAAAAAAAAE